MKKMFFLLAITLTAGGMVWAQYTWPTPDFPNTMGNSKDDALSAVFPGFNAMGVRSVEDRYAPGFNTMVEDYIDPAFFDPDIGTFLFMGGDPGNHFLDGNVAFGAAKTMGSFYAAVFYKGSIIGTPPGGGLGGQGVTSSNPEDGNKVYTNSSVIWNNNIALLFGVAGMGFRLDLIHSADDKKATYENNYTISSPDAANPMKISSIAGPKVALSWGSHFGNLYPSAKVGFKFPDILSVGGVDFNDSDMGTNYGKNATKSAKGALNIEAAGLYDFSGGNLTDMIIGTLVFGMQFRDSYKGDKEVITALDGYNPAFKDPGNSNYGKEYDYGGAWGVKLDLGYRKTFELGKFTLKTTPNLEMDMVSQSKDYSVVDEKNPTPTWFTLKPGITLGVKFQAFDKLAFFTGLDLSLLQWNTYATPGGGTKDDTAKWNINGIQWNDGTNNFNLGMAWTPVEGLVVSTGITSVLNAFVVFDVQNMSVQSGTLFKTTSTPTTPTNNVGDWLMLSLGKIFTSFELTVTYSF